MKATNLNAAREKNLVNTAFRHAVAAYRCLEELVNSSVLSGEKVSDRYDAVDQLVLDEFNRAETRLLQLILSTDPDLDPRRYCESPKLHCPPRAVIDGDTMFLATPYDQLDGLRPDYQPMNEENAAAFAMRLVIVPLANVTTLEAAGEHVEPESLPWSLPALPARMESRN